MNPAVATEALVKSYAGRRVVDQLSFAVYPGEVVGLLGPNGAGKTTAFYMTVGLIRPDSGHVYFGGEDVTRLPMHKRAQRGLGYLAQEPCVFGQLTVEENLRCILESLGVGRVEQEARIDELLGELHLTKCRTQLASDLSGGQRRRLEITRALATKPSCLLLDEPFANIDPLSIQDLQQVIRHLAAQGIAVLITDHNAREIFSIVDRSYLVHGGTVMASGTVEDLMQNRDVRRHYLGEEFSL